MNRRVRKEAEKVLATNGRRGCSTDALYDIIQSYFSDLLKKSLKQAAVDLTFSALNNDFKSTGLGSINNDLKNVLSSSQEVLMRYAKGVGDKTNKDIERKFTEFGVRPEHLDIAKKVAKNLLSESKEEDNV